MVSIEKMEEIKAQRYDGDPEEGISPEIRSKTKLNMKDRDLKQIESKVRDHIQKTQKKNLK